MIKKSIQIAAIETFYGGSHKVFIDGLKKYSQADITLFTLPDSSWRWRMKTGVLEIMRVVSNLERYDFLLVTSLCNLTELKGLLGAKCPPVILYVHENQLTYPRAKRQKEDFHLQWIDCMNVIAADYVIYNSESHRAAFFSAFQRFINNVPQTVLDSDALLKLVQVKSKVIYPGTDTPTIKRKKDHDDSRPRIVWNHRWEYDKQPQLFFDTILQCANADFDFELILLGEIPTNSLRTYQPFIEKLKSRIIHHGFVENREKYFETLATGDIIISTAIQENFGLSVVEAVQCGCFPLLPQRLSYPEIIPDAYHKYCLYRSDDHLFKALTKILEGREFANVSLETAFECHRWRRRIDDYDSFFHSIY